MEQIAVASLTGKPLFVNSTEKGLIKKVAFDLSTGTVLGIIITKNTDKIVYKENIVNLAKQQAIASKNPEDITENSLADRANQQDYHLLGLPAVTESGEKMGYVADALLLSPSLALTHLVIKEDSGERILPKNQIKEITPKAVIFFDAVVKGHLNWQTKMETDNLSA